MKRTFFFLLAFAFASCQEQPSAAPQHKGPAQKPIINAQGTLLESRFNPPPGYQRIALSKGSYGYFLRRLPLKPQGSVVRYFDGREKPNPGIYAAVVNMEIGNKDLQQCADAVMRLRAEYLYAAGRAQEISFDFTNGFRADYEHWRDGYRISVAGNRSAWVKRAQPADNHDLLWEYLQFVYNYAGTLSLSKELKTVPYEDMQIGDVLIVGGSPGHAVTVMDMAVNSSGKKVYLLSQSYMPAQEIQVLENPSDPSISPWYKLDRNTILIRTPQWDFTSSQLKRFP